MVKTEKNVPYLFKKFGEDIKQDKYQFNISNILKIKFKINNNLEMITM